MKILSTALLVLMSAIVLGQTSFNYTHRHMIRSGSNPYSKSVSIQLNDKVLKYAIVERGNETNAPRNGEIELTDEQVNKINRFIESKGLAANHNESLSGDTGKFDAYNLNFKNGDKSHLISLSLGAEDESKYKIILEEFEQLLNSFIPQR